MTKAPDTALRPGKLGRLVVGEPPDQDSMRQAKASQRPGVAGMLFGIGLVALPGLLGLAIAWQSGWLAAQLRPKHIVLRGNQLSSIDDILEVVGGAPQDNYLSWMHKSQEADCGKLRWLRAVNAYPRPSGTLVIQVDEQLPVLRVESAGAGYWLTDAGTVERAQLDDHKLDLFRKIKERPVIRLSGIGVDSAPSWSPRAVEAGLLCHEVLPGQINSVGVSQRGELTLTDRLGLEIRLGSASDLPIRIAALPKILRGLGNDRSKLAYLDATGRIVGEKLFVYEVRRGVN